jgi:hypothetical protein
MYEYGYGVYELLNSSLTLTNERKTYISEVIGIIPRNCVYECYVLTSKNDLYLIPARQKNCVFTVGSKVPIVK